MNKNTYYFDNNATTNITHEVLDEMIPYLENFYGNPSSIYPFGVKVRGAIENARHQLAELIGSKETEIIITSGGTESNCSAIMSGVNLYPEKKHIITSSVEHSSILTLLRLLEAKGYKVDYIPVDSQGRIDYEYIQKSISANTLLVSVMYANNEIGNIYDIKRICEIARYYGACVHTDAVQAVGKIPIDVNKLDVDMLSLSGHKFHAPKGVGALYIRENKKYYPLISGHQENGKRGGTENVASIVAIGKAAEITKKNIVEKNIYISNLRDEFEKFLINTFTNVYIYGDCTNRLSNTTNVAFEDIKGEEIVLLLALKGIYVSTGSACNSKSIEPSHVLSAMSVPENRVRSIRVSFSESNTFEDVIILEEQLTNAIKQLARKKEMAR